MSDPQLEANLQDQRADLLLRLRCAAGHLQAVADMIEAGQPCDQTLHQLHAVQSALGKIGVLLVRQETQACIEELRQQPCQDETARRIQRLVWFYQQYF